MLSYRTIIAIQLINILHQAEGKRFSITDMKVKIRLDGNGIGQIIRQLNKNGWVDSNTGNKYWLVADLGKKTLYDLVMAIDGHIQLNAHVSLPHWASDAENELPNAIRINEELNKSVVQVLKKVTIRELIKK